ncbi:MULTISPECIES: carboxypeptidase-like regulatory domain-containing protein [Sphingobacterium]|uniref:carboxypeptidase-like regulatory domain-containing protein n=1 Tax=Sphingobacterium TaxID=28453 RepID=UPI0013DC06D2|nr:MULTISPECIES: carboxypeptidase-like regulatory domain-containing protein [unclassified Sphingobacterium]
MLQYLKYLFVLFFALNGLFVHAQSKNLVQFSGLISSIGSDLPVAYVTIKNTSFNNQTFISNNDGYFSFVAHSGDTIRFSSVGYDPLTFVVPHVASDKFTAHIQMRSLVIELPAVTPFPWASYEDYLADFMGMKEGYDPVASARNNISPEAMAALARIVPRNADEIQNFNSTQRHINMTNKNINQRYANPLLNPFAWAQLINQIQRGDYSRQKLKY